MKTYFITEGSSNNYFALNYMVKALVDADYFEKAHEEVDAEFVNLGNLYRLLTDAKGEDTKIILSKYATPFEKVLKDKYPLAQIEHYKPFSGK